MSEQTPASRVLAWRRWFGVSFDVGLSGPTVENNVVDDVQVLSDLAPLKICVRMVLLSPVRAMSPHTSHVVI